MAISGSTNFILTGKEIVTSALNLIAERASEIPVTNNEISDGLRSLNLMTKALQISGNHLWAVEQNTLKFGLR